MTKRRSILLRRALDARGSHGQDAGCWILLRVYKLVGNDVVITASGGSIGPFRYAVLYNDTPTSPADPLIAWWDYGSSTSINNGENLTVDLDQVAGIFTVT